MAKTTFYIFLIGRLTAGAIIAAGAFSFAQGRPLPQMILIDIGAFALVSSFFWVSPFTYKQYLRATNHVGSHDSTL